MSLIQKNKEIDIVLHGGGIGDLIASYPTILHLKRKYDRTRFNIYTPDIIQELTRYVLHQKIKNIHQFEKRTILNPVIHTAWDDRFTPMRIHPAQFNSIMLGDELLPINQLSYPQPNLNDVSLTKFRSLPKNYIVLSIGSKEYVKLMDKQTFNIIKKYLISQNINMVLLGTSSVNKDFVYDDEYLVSLDFNDCINLIDKTSLVESLKIIKNSRLFIGMDGGLVHLAGMTNVPIIAGYTFVSPDRIMPIRNGEIGYNCVAITPTSTHCRFCQTENNLLVGVDFRSCPNNKNYECRNLDSNYFIEAIRRSLNV